MLGFGGKKKPRNADTQPGQEVSQDRYRLRGVVGTGEQNWGSGDWFQGERRSLIGLVLSGNGLER